jgi:hypothetical protein
VNILYGKTLLYYTVYRITKIEARVKQSNASIAVDGRQKPRWSPDQQASLLQTSRTSYQQSVALKYYDKMLRTSTIGLMGSMDGIFT